jgi:clan AA aspartic protease
MGAIHVTVNLSWTEANGDYEELFLVDTGATDSMVPASKLLELGFKPVGKMDYELANGDKVTYQYSGAIIKFLGDTTFGRIIFGPDNCEPILGVTALESTGIIIDPSNRQLKRLPAIPLK